MLPPRVTGVDPSLAMVEEARFLLLRSILTMRMIMMKTMLKKLKSLQCCVWYVNGMCTMSFQWSGNLSLSLGFNSRQAGRRTFHRQTTRHRYIGTIGTGTFIDQLPVLLQPGFLVYFLLDDANSHPSNWLIHKSLSPCLCPLCPQFYSFFFKFVPKVPFPHPASDCWTSDTLFQTSGLLQGSWQGKQLSSFYIWLLFSSFFFYSLVKNYPKVLVPGGVVAYYSVHFPTVLDEQVDK